MDAITFVFVVRGKSGVRVIKNMSFACMCLLLDAGFEVWMQSSTAEKIGV